MKKKRFNKKIIVLVVICLVSLGFNHFTAYSNNSLIKRDMIDLSKGWDVCIGHYYGSGADFDINSSELPAKAIETYKDLDLPEIKFSMFNRYDSVLLRIKLPEKLSSHPILIFNTVHSVMKVYIDNEIIYEYGSAAYDRGEIVGYGSHNIPINDTDAGKEMIIMLLISENEAFTSFEQPKIADSVYYLHDFATDNFFQIAIIIFIIMFGFILCCGSVIFFKGSSDLHKLLSIGMFAMCIGLWSFCNTGYIQIFMYNLQLKTYLEFATLYVAPWFLFLYFLDDVRKDGGIGWLVYRIILTVVTCFIAMSFIFQVTHLVRLPQLLKTCQLLLLIMVVYTLIHLIVRIFKGEDKSPVILYGFLFLSVFVISDVLRFNMQKYMSDGADTHYVNMIHFGVLIFVNALLTDFCMTYIRGVFEKVESETLQRMAFTDHMTGLHNRRYMEDYMDEIDKAGLGFTVVAFDINELKRINDTMGHNEGDRYITEFARVLSESFGPEAVCARSGGDEFIAIIKGKVSTTVDEIISKLEAAMADVNRINPEWRMSTAYGVCNSDEPGVDDIRKACKIADSRMYDCKQRMKAEQGVSAR